MDFYSMTAKKALENHAEFVSKLTINRAVTL